MLGLLEAREKKVREEVAPLREEAERVQATLAAAEGALERPAGALAAVAEMLAETLAGGEPVRGAGCRARWCRTAPTASVSRYSRWRTSRFWPRSGRRMPAVGCG
ncbi:hypothetical protein [Streptomyces sp. AcE210]|uniref:hypothetical protein n=1 Tax=Streptomyces sp. AcE210 TaxID=2292703 RepID=UPI000E302C1D|nr:hypothetical protein [Streptomyces sp. AcE210]RFC70914.1 hypothetical protein DXZ75_27215 [Streptomyces sp. AcE210]